MVNVCYWHLADLMARPAIAGRVEFPKAGIARVFVAPDSQLTAARGLTVV
jgi:hypothetical protein